MYLVLEVVSPQAASMGAQRRRIVGPKGLTIGRVAGNDWVIVDPYISKQHARISCANGSYLVEGLGRNPIAIGTADSPIPSNQPRALKNGDHLFIDQYEVLVTVMQGDSPEATRPVAKDDPFGIVSAEPQGGPLDSTPTAPGAKSAGQPGSIIPDIWDRGVPGTTAETAELDPLAALGGAAQSLEPDLPPVNWQQASPLADHFEAPAPRTAAPTGVPDNWDRSVLTPPRTPPSSPPRELQTGIPESWDRSILNPPSARGSASPPSQSPPQPRRAPPQTPATNPIPGAGFARGGETDRAVEANRRVEQQQRPISPPAQSDAALRGPGRQPPPRPEGAPPPRTPPNPPRPADVSSRAADFPERGSGGSGRVPDLSAPGSDVSARSGDYPRGCDVERTAGPPGDLADLLRGAGLSERDLSPEIMNELGKVLRVVVEGVMEVLRARTQIKSQFRVPLTRVQARENNPLKLSPNVESALHTLLIQRNQGYLPTVQAFEDAFADIRNHQMAMLEGLRVAFDSMLQSFDPHELEEEFERGVKRGGLLGLGAKSKYWELYVERFSHLGRDADDTFRRLFGDVFADAYEKQLERLKNLRNHGGRN